MQSFEPSRFMTPYDYARYTNTPVQWSMATTATPRGSLPNRSAPATRSAAAHHRRRQPGRVAGGTSRLRDAVHRTRADRRWNVDVPAQLRQRVVAGRMDLSAADPKRRGIRRELLGGNALAVRTTHP